MSTASTRFAHRIFRCTPRVAPSSEVPAGASRTIRMTSWPCRWPDPVSMPIGKLLLRTTSRIGLPPVDEHARNEPVVLGVHIADEMPRYGVPDERVDHQQMRRRHAYPGGDRAQIQENQAVRSDREREPDGVLVPGGDDHQNRRCGPEDSEE